MTTATEQQTLISVNYSFEMCVQKNSRGPGGLDHSNHAWTQGVRCPQNARAGRAI